MKHIPKARHLKNFDELQKKAGPPRPDEDLLRPYLVAKKQAGELAERGNSEMRKELEAIERIVANSRKTYLAEISRANLGSSTGSINKKGKSYQEVCKEVAQEFRANLLLSGAFVSSGTKNGAELCPSNFVYFWDIDVRARVAASYAYHHDLKGGKDGPYYDDTKSVTTLSHRSPP